MWIFNLNDSETLQKVLFLYLICNSTAPAKEFKTFVSFLKREVKRGPRRTKLQAEGKIKIPSQRQKYRAINYHCFFLIPCLLYFFLSQ